MDSCLDGAGCGWRDLAQEESWPQLYNPMAVLGVVGGSGAHRVATRQFRAPSLPRVIVCTDTLKEGVTCTFSAIGFFTTELLGLRETLSSV